MVSEALRNCEDVSLACEAEARAEAAAAVAAAVAQVVPARPALLSDQSGLQAKPSTYVNLAL